MDDPILNCVLTVCCPPFKAEAMLTRLMVKYGASEGDAHLCAEFMLNHFDLAEKGTLAPLKESIARLARGPSPKDAA